MKTLHRTFMLAMLAGSVASTALAHEYTLGGLKIGHPWTRATPAGSDMAAAYLSVTNTGRDDDRLTAATFDAAKEVSIHDMNMDDGVMKMRALPGGIALKASETTVLAPGGTHLMLMGLSHELKEGDWVSGTLVFEKAGTLPVRFKVEKVGATMPAGMHMGH